MAVCALALAGCGGSSGGAAGPAKQGACIDAGSAGAAHVVGCGSASAKATLVDNGAAPSQAIACVTIDAGTQNDFSVTVAGKVYCARPKSSGTPTSASTSASTTTTSSAETIPASFVAALEKIKKPYQKWAEDIAAALQHGGSQTDAQLENTFHGLLQRATALSVQLERLLPAPAPISSPYQQLVEGTNKALSALAHVTAAAATHSTALARTAFSDLNQALVEAANGIVGLKSAGIK